MVELDRTVHGDVGRTVRFHLVGVGDALTRLVGGFIVTGDLPVVTILVLKLPELVVGS